jgi:PAS domain S-box-containing protein
MDKEDRARRRQHRVWLSLTAAALLIALSALIAGTVAFARQSVESEAQAARQAVLNEDLRLLQTLMATVDAGESDQRGFLLTGRQTYLDAYTVSVHRVEGIQNQLDVIASMDPKLQMRIGQLQTVTARKLADMDATLRINERNGAAEATKRLQADTAPQEAQQIRSAATRLLDEVRAERDALNLAQARASTYSRQLAVGTALTLIVLISLTGIQILRLSRARDRYEAQLAVSERRHREIVEEQSELIAVVDTAGILRYANPAFKRYFGKAGDVGSTVYELVRPEDRQASQRNFATVLRTGETRLTERWMRLADGEERWIAWVTRLQLGENGERMSYTVGRDITQRKQA